MDAPRSYNWSTFCAWGLTASGAGLGLAGVSGAFAPDALLLGLFDPRAVCLVSFAAMIAFATACVNNAAAAAMHAMSRPGGWKNWHWPTLIPAVVSAAIFATAANLGIHLGWELLASFATIKLPPTWAVDAAFWALCFAKAANAWIREGRLTIDRMAQAEADAAEERRLQAVRDTARAERDARLEAPSARPAPRPTPPSRSTVADLGEARRNKMARVVTEEEIRVACRALKQRGVTPSFRTVADEMTVARSRVERAWPKGVSLAAAS